MLQNTYFCSCVTEHVFLYSFGVAEYILLYSCVNEHVFHVFIRCYWKHTVWLREWTRFSVSIRGGNEHILLYSSVNEHDFLYSFCVTENILYGCRMNTFSALIRCTEYILLYSCANEHVFLHSFGVTEHILLYSCVNEHVFLYSFGIT